MSETPENRIKRLKMRSWHRGTKEMDMILGPYSDTQIASLSPELLDSYESMIAQNDQDLYVWMIGRVPTPAAFIKIVGIIQTFHKLV